MKLSTQKAVTKCPRKKNIKRTELAPQSQEEDKTPLRHLHPLIFSFLVLYLILFEIYFLLHSEPLPLEQGPSRQLHLKKPFKPKRPFRDFFFFFPFQTKAVYKKTPVVLVLCFVLPPLSALHPASSRGAQKRGHGSWRAHHRLGRSCRGNSARTPADVRAWNKSGSLACLGRPLQGQEGWKAVKSPFSL